jgi:hypothetical protein
VRVPGTNLRFGLDALLGLLPVGGDVAGGVLSTYVILTAHRLGAGPAIVLRMGGNILIDTFIGTVPLLGDLFDAGWKANRRNMALLDRYLETPLPVRRSSTVAVTVVVAVVVGLAVAAAYASLAVLRALASAI